MRDTDRAEFARIVNGLSGIKPGQKLTADGLELFWRAMQHWDLAVFRDAAAQLARTVEFMPNPYHFEQLRKAQCVTVGEAFDIARRVCREAHPRDFPTLSSGNERIDAAIRACGGWSALAVTTAENRGFFENRFRDHFEAISDAEDTRAALPDLTGGPKLRVTDEHGRLLRFEALP